MPVVGGVHCITTGPEGYYTGTPKLPTPTILKTVGADQISELSTQAKPFIRQISVLPLTVDLAS